jgi:lipopolysaccharide export system protein LptA
MTLDIISGVMQFKNVHGYIRFPNSLGQTKPVQFNAGTLIWNEKKNRLTLQDHVSIVSDPFGTLTTEGKVELELKDVNGQMILEKLIVDGNSSSVVQPNTQYSMNIQCNGHVEVNHSKKTITMQSPSQVEIKTDTGILSSDKITLNYSLEEDRFVPKYTVLEGNVKLRNHIMVDVRRPGPLDQYALADRVVIDLPTDTFVLSGVNGKRILFYDRINNLKMSAPEITVSKDPQTHKQVVKGKGDVRFTFLENEYDLLKRSFR